MLLRVVRLNLSVGNALAGKTILTEVWLALCGLINLLVGGLLDKMCLRVWARAFWLLAENRVIHEILNGLNFLISFFKVVGRYK